MESLNSAPEQPQPPAPDHRALGAKILTQAGFEIRQKPIVDSSFNRAKQRHEKLPGKNNERKNYAYLSRLDNLIEKHGNALEKRLWAESADKLVISPEDIDDNYWRTQEQILRDNGQGRTLTDYDKRILTSDIIEKQRQSLATWSDYLGDERSPYPMWFKVYAWDGMSKMGTFDKGKQQFMKRDKHTVAPYPHLNPAALAKTYDAIINFYGPANLDRNDSPELKALVSSGNFNKLYSKVLLTEKAIPKTPERTEDIQGAWLEYNPGDEEKLASAAEGTPWCVASSAVGKSYLTEGKYGQNAGDNPDSKAKFFLFRLEDPETNTLSSTACASIRLDPDGKVAEISGLNDGQALEDSLVPIVEEKVKTLPGGTEFLEKFADKNHLIALDRKMQAGEDITKDDLEFLYAIHRPIKTLDTYNEQDPRIAELKARYDLEYVLDAGVSAEALLPRLSGEQILDYWQPLTDHGASLDINGVIWRGESVVRDRLEQVLSHDPRLDVLLHQTFLKQIQSDSAIQAIIDHYGVEAVSSQLDAHSQLRFFDPLQQNGANLDINTIASQLSADDVAANLAVLVSRGAEIDFNELALNLSPSALEHNYEKFLWYNPDFDVNLIVPRLGSEYLLNHMDTLAKDGADINLIVANLSDEDVNDKLKYLLQNPKIDANLLIPRLSPENLEFAARKLYPTRVIDGWDAFVASGYTPDIDRLVDRTYSSDIIARLDFFQSHGAHLDANEIAEHLHYSTGDELAKLVSLNPDLAIVLRRNEAWLRNDADHTGDLQTLINHYGVDAVASGLSPHNRAKFAALLNQNGANLDVNQLVSELHVDETLKMLDTLVQTTGIDIDRTLDHLSSAYISHNIDAVLNAGIDINQVVQHLTPEDQSELLPYLIEHGVQIDATELARQVDLSDLWVMNPLFHLLDYGADANLIASKLPPDLLPSLRDELIDHGADPAYLAELAQRPKSQEGRIR